MKNTPHLKIGTCSWKYDSWKGIVYNDGSSQNYLKDYAKHYSTVEIDQWFWSLHPGNKVTLPRDDVVVEYAQSVPEDFKFSVKVPNSITLTHHYSRDKSKPLVPNPYFLSNELFSDFLDRLSPLKDKLGPLMFQFEYLNKKKMASQDSFQKQFLNFIKECPKDYTYAMEIRNPNYLNDAYFDFLNSNRLAMVFLQGYYMPSIFPLYEKFKDYVQELSVIRMHGYDRKEMEKKTKNVWNEIIEPKDNELDRLAEMIHELLDRNTDIYLNINNHYEGSAPRTIERIRERLNV